MMLYLKILGVLCILAFAISLISVTGHFVYDWVYATFGVFYATLMKVFALLCGASFVVWLFISSEF